MRDAPAIFAACTAARPTAPQPNTATDEPASTYRKERHRKPTKYVAYLAGVPYGAKAGADAATEQTDTLERGGLADLRSGDLCNNCVLRHRGATWKR